MAEGVRGDIGDDRQVENGGISNTVEVRGFSANINKELLEMYFENSRRSGGGDTEEVQIGDGVAYITFMEAEAAKFSFKVHAYDLSVAHRVVSHSNHQVDGQTLTVALFHPKPCYENRVLIQGLNNAITEEMLTKFLGKGTEVKVREFLYGEDEGKVVVTLSDNIDIAQFRRIFRERRIENASLQVARVDISNCIIVQNLQPSTTHDVALYYFENKRRSGGGDVERVEMKADEGFCLVYFEDPSVINRVLSQSHKVDGADVEVHIHHECLGQRSSRKRFDPFLRISSPEQTDSAILEEENIDDQAKDKTSSSVSSNPENESDFVEVQEWQENDGKNCTLPLWIKYTRAPEMMITKDMKKIPCSWNFHVYWNFYTKTTLGKQLLHEIISKYNCTVAVCSDDEDLFIFEISAKSFEQESDVIHFIHDVLDSIYKSAQQFLYFDILLIEQRMQGDVLQLMKQRKELDSSRIVLMGQQDNDAMCVVCTEKDKKSVHHIVTEIIHNVRECFGNHEEIISIDHKWQKVMKTFGYIQKLGFKFPKVTIIFNETKPAILLKGPRDQSKAAADHLMELIGTAQTEIKEDIFSPGCQFEIFTYPEMCDYIDSIMMELSIVWIPDQLTKKIHIFSKKLDKVKSIDKLIKGCVQERAYPLERDQSVHSLDICSSLEKLKRKHKGKIVMNLSPRGLFVTVADDIFESVDVDVLEILSKQTDPKDSCINVKVGSKQAGIPISSEISSDSVTLVWGEPHHKVNAIQYYKVKYKIHGERKWCSIDTVDKRNSFRIENLKSNTAYDFRVQAVYDDDDDDEAPLSSICQNIMTKEKTFRAMPKLAQNLTNGKLTIYKLPLTVNQNSDNEKVITRKCVFGNRPCSFQEKTVMVVGGTGVGKSTMIDAFVNYIMDINWEDNLRYSIIDVMDEGREKFIDESKSQTEWITCYTFFPQEDWKLDYTFHMIDTPGFGTGSIEMDRAIVHHLGTLFNSSGKQGIKILDAVWFVTRAEDTRLMVSQKYIFDTILSIFGKDIEENIFVVVTFADNKNPPVLKALREAGVPFRNHVIFNNSVLFYDKDYDVLNECGPSYWKMGQNSFKQLFDELQKTQPRSMQLTAEVLETRRILEATIQGLQSQIRYGLSKLDTIQQEERIFEEHAAKVVAYEEFEYNVTETHQVKVDLPPGTYVLNCLNCNGTCHYPCFIPKNEDPSSCPAMINGKCQVCIKKCDWQNHVNQPYRLELFAVTVRKTNEQMKLKYVLEQKEKEKHLTILDKLKEEFDEIQVKVSSSIQYVRKSVNRLKQIALKEDPLSHTQYIDLLIECEKRERKPRFLERMKLLEDMKKQAELLQTLSDKTYNPWAKFTSNR